MSGRCFQYPPLEEHDSIRLLHIYRAQYIDEPLYVGMIQRSLSSIGDSSEDEYAYTALSYCWGSQDIKRPVFIEPDMLFIGQNLSDALCHMRKVDSDIIVWADGLCINQEDVVERSRQVKMMRNIYSKAAKTIVFLGIEVGNTSMSAWNYLERESSDYSLNARKEPESSFRGDLQDVEIDVLTRPWFRRVWVMQEVVVSKKIFLQCGQRLVSWDDFCRTLLLQPRVNDRYGFSLMNHHLYEYLLRMFSARSAFLRSHGRQNLLLPWYDEVDEEESRSDGLLDMLSRARSLEATEPRDKIFALLGISSGMDRDVEALLIDYSLSVVTVYRNFARYMIGSTHSYEILSYVASTVSDGIPSWAPDWRFGTGLTRNILSTLPREDRESFRSRQRVVKQNHDWLEAGDLTGKSLLCVGRVIAQITEITIPIRLHADEEWGFERLRDIYKDDQKELQKAILRKWEDFPWTRVDDTNYLVPWPADLPVGAPPGISAQHNMMPAEQLGMGNRLYKSSKEPLIRPAIPDFSEHDNLYMDEIFRHRHRNIRKGFLPLGTFVPPKRSEQRSSEKTLSRRSLFSKQRFKSLLRKQPQMVEPSTSTATTEDSVKCNVEPGSIKAHLLQ